MFLNCWEFSENRQMKTNTGWSFSMPMPLEWFKTKNVKVLEWPNQSLDINLIGNLWQALTRKLLLSKGLQCNLTELEQEKMGKNLCVEMSQKTCSCKCSQKLFYLYCWLCNKPMPIFLFLETFGSRIISYRNLFYFFLNCQTVRNIV